MSSTIATASGARIAASCNAREEAGCLRREEVFEVGKQECPRNACGWASCIRRMGDEDLLTLDRNGKLVYTLRVKKGAVVSHCSKYRYSLSRTWDESLPSLLCIGLNPSTADAENDDPTIRREISFAKSNGFGGLLKGNLFAFRATDPGIMMAAEDPVGPDNDLALIGMMTKASCILAAWGARGGFKGRDKAVAELLKGRKLMCLGRTKEGHPRHPLYVKGDVSFMEWCAA